MSRFIFLSCFFFFALGLAAQTPQDIVVPLQISTGLNPPAVFLSWENPQPSDLILRRRVKGELGNTWVELVNATQTQLNGYFDGGLDGNQTYEYAVERKTGNITAYGYAFANFFKPVVDYRGKLLVFIDSTTADQLGADLVLFKNDIRGEGWETMPFKTGPSTTVQWVKNQIQAAYNADPANVKAVLLMGEVPVPYSGDMAWDTKPDHVGAWPADAFYGDVDGVWTDNTVNLPNTARLANRNVPGDGKFDQNQLPSAVEIPVGRLDFRHLLPATFGLNSVELLRRYIFKNHRWRTAQYPVPKRALVDDHLGWSGGEAFAANGYRNAIPLVGSGNVEAGDFLNPQRFLLAYGAGANGTYSSADGIGTAANFATDSVRSVFANLYGDYFGDWDFETNPLLPALLASKGGVLTASWAGRPHWMQHGLATGETIGYCLTETQNAQYNTAYGYSNGESGAHISLLGDPTLRAKIVAPATNVSAVSNCTKVNLHWTASADPEVAAYLIYRSFNLDGPYERVTPDLIFQTSWEDTNPVAGPLFYSVRAVNLEVTPGGGAFYNSSSGAPVNVTFVPSDGPTAIGLGGFLNCNVTSLTLGTNFSPPNSSVQWYKPNGDILNGFTATEGGVYTVVVTAPNGCTTAAYATVYVDTLLPEIVLPSQIVLTCSDPVFSYTLPQAAPEVHYFLNGAEVFPGQVIQPTSSFTLAVSSGSNGCSKNYNVGVLQDLTPPGAFITHNGLTLDCNHPSVQLFGISNSPNVSYEWTWQSGQFFSTEQDIEVVESGTYCLLVTGLNACTSSTCIPVTESNMVLTIGFSLLGNPCASDGKALQANVAGGAEPYEFLWSTGGDQQTELLPNGFSGMVTVTITDANGCAAASSFNVAPLMDVLALTNQESFPGAADGYVDLLVLNGQAPLSYLWSNGSTAEDIVGLSSGTYTVTVTNGNGCTVVLAIPLFTVAVEEVGDWPKVQISPNPANDVVEIKFSESLPSSIGLRLTDLSGRSISFQEVSAAKTQLNTEQLPSGLYLIWLERGNGRVAYKLAIQK